MKTKTIIQKILNESIVHSEPIPTGLTNDNYHVVTKSHNLVLRVPKPENAHLFDYAHEAKLLHLIKDLKLEPELIYYDENTGIKCAQYVEDARTLTPKDYLHAVDLLAKLHNANLISGESFNILSKYDLYKAQAPLYDLSAFEHYIHQANENMSHVRLCHNDCVEGNFLFTENKNYLIDYEYASDNDPYFDLLSLITENDITDPAMKESMIKSYFSQVNIPYDKDKITIYEGALHTLWCAWACSMYERFEEPIYKHIADLKYQRLLEM